LTYKARQAEAVAEENAKLHRQQVKVNILARAEAETTAASLQIDLNLAEIEADVKVGLLQLANPIKQLQSTSLEDLSVSDQEINKGAKIQNTIPDKIQALRQFQTAAILTSGQHFSPLLPPLRHEEIYANYPDYAISPRGTTIITWGKVELCVWNAKNAILLYLIKNDTNEKKKCGYSRDGTTIYAFDSHGPRFWNADTGQLIADGYLHKTGHRFWNEREAPYECVLENNRLITVSGDLVKLYELWDATTGRLIMQNRRIIRSQEKFYDDHLDRQGKWFLVPEGKHTLAVYSALDGKFAHRLQHRMDKVLGMYDIEPKGRFIATYTYSESIQNASYSLHIWDTQNWNSNPLVYSGNEYQKMNKYHFNFVDDRTIFLSSSIYKIADNTIIKTYYDDNAEFFGSGVRKVIDSLVLTKNYRVFHIQSGKRIQPQIGNKYPTELTSFADDGRFVDNIDTLTGKMLPRQDIFEKSQVGFGSLRCAHSSVLGYKIILCPSPIPDIPPALLHLWVQVAVRGELDANGEFVKWDEPTWEKKRQELAAAKPPYPDFPFPGYVATDKFHWLRAEFKEASEVERQPMATELLRPAEASGDKNEAVRWRAEVTQRTPELAPLPRER
jgi:WD40 repeat protein